MCNNEHLKWINMAPLIFWADPVTVCLSIGYSPYFMAHGVEVVLPLDISEATYHLPPLDVPSSTEDLIAHHAQQLQKNWRISMTCWLEFWRPGSNELLSLSSASLLPTRIMTFQLDHLSLCATPLLKMRLTGRLILISWASWWLSIAWKEVHIFWPSWIVLSQKSDMRIFASYLSWRDSQTVYQSPLSWMRPSWRIFRLCSYSWKVLKIITSSKKRSHTSPDL